MAAMLAVSLQIKKLHWETAALRLKKLLTLKRQLIKTERQTQKSVANVC